MKNDPLTGILTVVLVASTLGAAAMCYKYLVTARDFRYFQEEVARVNQRKNLANSLALELNQYSLSNPRINPLLERMSLKMQVTTNTPAHP